MYPSPRLEARMLNGESEMCNQVRGFHRAVRKFIAKIQMTFPNCADINFIICVFIHTYFQAKLNSKSLVIAIHMSHPNSKSSTISHSEVDERTGDEC